MYSVGLTGNIAAGKTSVTRWFAAWGATVLDADEIVRELQAPGTPVFRAIVDRFGDEVVAADGALDRQRLRDRVFADPEARADLNQIVHPAVADRRRELEAEARDRGDLIVVNAIPLLFEVLDPAAFDAVVLVDAPATVRRERLMRDRGLTAAAADAMIAAQMPAEEKRSRSTHVVDNTSTLAALEQRTRAVWDQVRTAAARTTPAPGPLVFVLSHPDDESYGCGGTIARYAEAETAIHLICATDGEAGSHSGLPPVETGSRRRRDLDEAAAILGIREVIRLGLPDGRLDPDDPTPVDAIVRELRRIVPAAVITFGPDGVTGHRDHLATATWARAAAARVGPATRFLEIAFSAEALRTFPQPIHRRPEAELTVQLDVRPWLERKRRAIAAHGTQRPVFDLDSPEVQPYLAREWFVEPAAPGPRRTVLI